MATPRKPKNPPIRFAHCPTCAKETIYTLYKSEQKIMPSYFTAQGIEVSFTLPYEGNRCTECNTVYCTHDQVLNNVQKSLLRIQEMLS